MARGFGVTLRRTVTRFCVAAGVWGILCRSRCVGVLWASQRRSMPSSDDLETLSRGLISEIHIVPPCVYVLCTYPANHVCRLCMCVCVCVDVAVMVHQ